jgi:hypothetical protein
MTEDKIRVEVRISRNPLLNLSAMLPYFLSKVSDLLFRI